jgi:L-cysteine S-thiosulfotransferase
MLATAAEFAVSFRTGAGEISDPLTREPGDANRGRQVVGGREAGACVSCHEVPGVDGAFMGTLGPSLAGVGHRLSPAQLRLRLVDATLVNPATAMPSYYRIEGLNRVAREYLGKPLLSAQQIEDVIAYLVTLK